jgi:hypothetical protein
MSNEHISEYYGYLYKFNGIIISLIFLAIFLQTVAGYSDMHTFISALKYFLLK